MHQIIYDVIVDAFGLALFINALLYLPQIFRVIRVRSSKGLSTITFFGFLFINLLAVSYGVIKHDTVLTFGYSISAILNFILVVLILRFR